MSTLDLATLWTGTISERLQHDVRWSFPWEKPIILKAVSPYFLLLFFSTFLSFTKIPLLNARLTAEKSFHWAADQFPVFSIEEPTSVAPDGQSKVQSSKLILFLKEALHLFEPLSKRSELFPFPIIQMIASTYSLGPSEFAVATVIIPLPLADAPSTNAPACDSWKV